MTATNRYHCNLCRDEIFSPEKTGKHGVGIHFVSDRSFQFRLIQDANNHLCDDCVHGIAEERRALTERDLSAK